LATHGIIHRDIKPDNILIAADGSMRLCDFGSACKCSGSATAVLTDYVATRWYRAPELLVRSNDYDKAVDMWGLGCVMVELTVGQPLFAGKSDIDQLNLIHKALGPLTPEQFQRCMALTHARDLHFPGGGASETLDKRFGRVMPAGQMELLQRVIVIDPAQRFSANAALALPWLREAQEAERAASRSSQASASPRDAQSTRGSAAAEGRRPNSRAALPPAPPAPARRAVSPCVVSPCVRVQGGGPKAGPPAAPKAAVGIVTRAPQLPVEVDVQESIASFSEDFPPQKRSPRISAGSLPEDPFEASIPEEIHSPRGSITEQDLQVDSGASQGSSCGASSYRARSSPPPARRAAQPVGQLVKRTRPASGREVHMFAAP